MPIDIAEARRLLSEATRAPWAWNDRDQLYGPTTTNEDGSERFDEPIIETDDGIYGPEEPDRALIVYLRNHAAELLDELEAKGTEVERLRDALATLYHGTRDYAARGMGECLPVDYEMPPSSAKRVRRLVVEALGARPATPCASSIYDRATGNTSFCKRTDEHYEHEDGAMSWTSGASQAAGTAGEGETAP